MRRSAIGYIAASMAQLTANGVQLINDAPCTRDNGKRYTFVRPKSTGGVLVELFALLRGN